MNLQENIARIKQVMLIEQSDAMMDRRGNALLNATGIRSDKDYKTVDKVITAANTYSADPHTVAMILGIGAAFIPVVGPFIAAGIGLADAALYYKEGDTKTASLVGAFSMIPFAGQIINKIPGARELGVRGMAALANKISYGKNLTKAESEIAMAVKQYGPEIKSELTKLAPKLKRIVNDLSQYKGNFIKKYGENEYNILLIKYLYGTVDEVTFLSKLKSVKTPNIKIKPIAGGGADHRVFQSATNPNVVFKAELRPGEIDKWFDLFNKHPKVFASTIKKTKVRDASGKMLTAVIMEKLDTVPFVKLWDATESAFNNLQRSLPFTEQVSSLEYLVKNINQPNYRKVWNKLGETIKQKSPDINNKFIEFSKMVDELYKITPKPDIRQFNFGYNKDGILKALDI
jgi:hypothetical protein